MDGDIEAEVLAAEQKRCKAMLANDEDELEAILDPRLHFAHATGAVDDKPAFLAKMATGRIRYIAIDWPEERVLALAPNTAMLTGRMKTDVEVEGVVKELRNRVITVWSKSKEGWRLVAFQSTPLAG